MREGEYAITPLGAAVVEAGFVGPVAKRIQNRFHRIGECPASKLFSEEEVERFYRDRGAEVKGVRCPPRLKS